ncbi:MAG: hypothetical protein DRQ10_08440 [Candidatus Hydrothermota bacterium]|nr:MAG: hypothetical protein DRQ10_08440 [Candidatus Hydrothermae bacterium]
MKVIYKIVLVVGLGLFVMSGCFYGSFHTAETVGPGCMQSGWYANFPVYPDVGVFHKSEEVHGGAYVVPNVGGFIEFGAATGLDVGVRGNLGEGISVFSKIQVAKGAQMGVPLDAAVLGAIGYHPVALGMSGRAELIVSTPLSQYGTLYFGGMLLRSPDYRKVLAITKRLKLSEFRDFRLFPFVFSGIELREGVIHQKVPFILTIELGVPLHSYPPLFIGFQVKR